jgi:hypothetical protein
LYGDGENVKVLLALLPSALHLDIFTIAKSSLLGTARGEVTLLFTDREGQLGWRIQGGKERAALDDASPAWSS